MPILRSLQHWLTGGGLGLQVADFVPETHPLRQWAETFPWAALVAAVDRSFAQRFPKATTRGRPPISTRVLVAAAGFIVALHLPLGNPSDASDVQPLLDHVQQAIARVTTAPRPAIHSLAGDWAFNDASLREALHQQGMLSVGIPHTVDPLPPSPLPEDVLRLLSEGDLPRARTPCQVHLAYACGYSRPVVESLIASRLCRGAAHLTYKGQRGAIVQTGMAVMAHNAATLVRIHEYCLSKRAHNFRRRLRLRCRKVNQCNTSIN